MEQNHSCSAYAYPSVLESVRNCARRHRCTSQIFSGCHWQ